MRTAKFWLGALVAGALALGYGCGSGTSAQNEDPQETPQQQLPDAGMDAGVLLTLTDAQIARILQVANDAAVSLGQFAAPLASEQAVIDYNNQLVAERTAAKQRLDAMLTAQGITPQESALSLQLQSDAQQLMQILSGPNAPAKGAALDQALVSAQLDLNSRIAFLDDSLLTTQLTNPALKQEATTERQALQMNINAAQALQTGMVLPPVSPPISPPPPANP